MWGAMFMTVFQWVTVGRVGEMWAAMLHAPLLAVDSALPLISVAWPGRIRCAIVFENIGRSLFFTEGAGSREL